MKTAHLLIRIPMVLLLLLGIVGGVLDVADLLNIPISGWIALSLPLALLVLDRELRVWSLAWQLNSKSNLQSRIDVLARFRDEVINVLYAGTPKQRDFATWMANFRAWEDSLVQYLQAEFPYAVFEMFKDQGLIPSASFEHVSKDPRIRKKHLSHLRRIAKHLQILERLIQNNTALTRQREPTLGEALSQAGLGA